MTIQEKLVFSDLPALKSSPDSVRQKFKDYFGGTTPDGISLNSETYFNAVHPAITEQYGHPCFKTLGDFTYTKGDGKPPTDAIVGSNVAINYGDEPATMSIEVQGNWTNEQSWSSSITTGLTLSTKFTIEGIFESGAEFSVSTTVGQSSSQSISKSSTASVTVTVPPRSKKKVVMVGTLKKEAMNFRAPISVTGMFGANFPKRVDGHYFWFLDARNVLNSISGEIVGTIKNTSVFDVHTEIGPTEPLKAEEFEAFALLTN